MFKIFQIASFSYPKQKLYSMFFLFPKPNQICMLDPTIETQLLLFYIIVLNTV